MINYIEVVINSLLRDLILKGSKTEIPIRNVTGVSTTANAVATAYTINLQGLQRENYDMCRSEFNMPTTDIAVGRRLIYGHLATRHRFALIIYLLGQTHDLLIKRNCCTYRELLYKNVHIQCDPGQISRGVKDICCMLGQTSWNLGIFASGKGMITGPLLIYMTGGDVIDCSCLTSPTLIPPNFTYIDHFETSAQMILVVEKDTIYKKLLLYNLFSAMEGKVLLVTAKGYPDVSTRWLLNKLVCENSLLLYMIADGDPFGIEIMLIYRHGSQTLSQNVAELACPSLKWLGIHPSDIVNINVPRESLAPADYRKIDSLLNRQYVSDEIRRELIILRQHQYKVKIDNMSVHSFALFINDYIINKIKRNIII